MTRAPLGEYTSIAFVSNGRIMKECQYSLMLDKDRLSSQTGWLMSRPFRHALICLWIYICIFMVMFRSHPLSVCCDLQRAKFEGTSLVVESYYMIDLVRFIF
jgi:hypothetical protein